MRKHGLLREDAKLAVDLTFEALKEVLLEGESVHFPRFGTFYPRYTKPREWTQPSTGETMMLKERARLAFKTTRRFDKLMTQALGDPNGTDEQAQAYEEDLEDETDFAEDEADDCGVEEDD